jgi:hypothetical protein
MNKNLPTHSFGEADPLGEFEFFVVFPQALAEGVQAILEEKVSDIGPGGDLISECKCWIP